MSYRYNGGVMDERMDVFLNMLYGDDEQYLQELAEYAEEIHAPIMRKQTAVILRFLIKKDDINNILEIGTAIGYSALYMAQCDSDVRIDTIEKVPARIEDAKRHFAKYDTAKRINLLEGDALEMLKKLADSDKKYDLIFLDAAKAQYSEYLPYIRKIMSDKATLVTDNVLQEGEILESRYAVNRRDRTIHSRMREFLRELCDEDKWNTIVLPVGDGMAISTISHTLL